jgi:hypothetical protein
MDLTFTVTIKVPDREVKDTIDRERYVEWLTNVIQADLETDHLGSEYAEMISEIQLTEVK